MIMSVVTGNTLQADITTLGIDNYLSRNGTGGGLRFMMFAFGFPAGLVVSATGLLATSEDRISHILPFGLLLLLACLMPALTLKLLGTERNTGFFGIAGYILMLLTIITMWHWSAHRRTLDKGLRRSADLQGAGYACFAMAAWNLCGVGGMPSFALDPEHMIAAGSRGFATAQMKAVMLLIILGWLLTLLGYRTSVNRSRGTTRRSIATSTSNTDS
jgi:hypothetical protein